jgi:Glycosyl transferase WecG/TagA/CpsF family
VNTAHREMGAASEPIELGAVTEAGELAYRLMVTRASVLGCDIDRVDPSGALAFCEEVISSRRFAQHMAINVAKLVAMSADDELRRGIKQCEPITADGQPVVWASRLLGDPLPSRVAGIDLMHGLLALASLKQYRVYIRRVHRRRGRADAPGPVLMQQSGLEWLLRLAQEPRRLGRRYLSTNTAFMLLLSREMMRAYIARRGADTSRRRVLRRRREGALQAEGAGPPSPRPAPRQGAAVRRRRQFD